MIRADVGDLVAVDPSIRSAGVSLFRNGILRKSARIRTPPVDATTVCTGVRCMRMAHAIAQWLIEVYDVEPRTLAFEWPQIYQRGGGRTKGDPNDLPGLAGVGMGLAGILAMAIAPRNVALDLVTFSPSEWKGQMPKDVSHHHIRRTLSPEELLVLVEQPDALDSVGVGLHTLRRLQLRGPRATRPRAGAIVPGDPEVGMG